MAPQHLIIIISIICAAMQFMFTETGAERIVAFPGQPEVDFKQYSGYITIDDEHEQKQRNLFYYLAEAETEPASKPLVLWLNGGPGCSSIGVGAFREHGPFKPRGDSLVKNDYSWNKEANMLYLESPAGVGFSYSANKSFYNSVTDAMTARDNLAFLERWIAEFPEYQGRDFFITGEGYGGHYVPQLAELIVRSKANFNLKGIAIGNPLLDFNTDFNSRAMYMWSHGWISDKTYELLDTVCNYSQIWRQSRSGSLSPDCSRVNQRVFAEAKFVSLDGLSTIESESKVARHHDYTGPIDACEADEIISYLNRKDVQEAFHAKLVGVSSWSTCSDVLHYEMQNLEIPTIPVLEKLVKSGIRVLVYSGDQDSVIPFIGTTTLVKELAKAMGLIRTVRYRPWFQGKQVAGRTQVYGDVLSFATIKKASHQVSFSQPEKSLGLFKAFLSGKQLPIGKASYCSVLCELGHAAFCERTSERATW